MRTRLRHVWEVLTTGYWFVPAIMMVAAAAMALGLLLLDRAVIGPGHRLAWLYAGGADGAMTLLSTVAGSVITVAGVVFSITIAALTQASSQFGPRLLRNFMRDVHNQVVLGTFVATFIYCLLVLRTIHSKTEALGEFVPQASVTVAVLLAAASIVVLIYFIHHVSVSLQPPAVVSAVRDDLERVIARLPDEHEGVGVPVAAAGGPAGHGEALPPNFDAAADAVDAACEGYVQVVDYDDLTAAAAEAGLVLRLEYRPGDYVIADTTLLRAWPAGRCGPRLAARLNDAFICGRHGTPEQDVEYAIRQMVEVAVRALSPAVNDPFTAIQCIDALGAALCRIARRGLPGPHRYDRAGALRVVTPVTTFTGLTDTAFNQIRQYGRESVAVTIRLLDVFAICAREMTSDEHRRSIRRHAEMVYRQGEEAIRERGDRDDLRKSWQTAARALGGAAGAEASADAEADDERGENVEPDAGTDSRKAGGAARTRRR